MFDFIERLRQKPEHVRKRIAAGTAITLTGIVTLGWVGALAAGNAFILKPTPSETTLTQSGSELSGTFSEARTSFSSLMGAAGTAQGGKESASLIIVDSESSSTLDTKAKAPDERTVIPF